MSMNIDAARLLVRKAVWLREKGKRNSLQAAHAKIFAADMAMWVATEAVQVFGGYGYSVKRLMCDVKLFQIYEGTSEIPRYLIAREVKYENSSTYIRLTSHSVNSVTSKLSNSAIVRSPLLKVRKPKPKKPGLIIVPSSIRAISILFTYTHV
ncbi:MAG: hypothetical protein GXO37_05900 [Chloroflexi bacterium]|nr:hypothetical protein [Chloroflexota bacterium]